MMPEWVTVEEASRVLRITRLSVRILMQQGRLPIGYVKDGPNGRKTYLISRELLERETVDSGRRRPVLLLEYGRMGHRGYADRFSYHRRLCLLLF